MATALFPAIKREGYRLIFHTNKTGAEIVRHNPHVDKVLVEFDPEKSQDELNKTWKEIGSKFDRFINLSGTVEGGCLAVEGSDEFSLSDMERRRRYGNRNYYEETFRRAGIDYERKNLGKLYFSSLERSISRKSRRKLSGRFVILWSLSGSSLHKCYPFTEDVVRTFLNYRPDAVVIFVGDEVCELLEFPHERVVNRSGKWTVRQTLLATEFADLVIGPETGVLVAAATHDVRKIIFLSHSSEENLTRDWTNTTAIKPVLSACYPCHQLHYRLASCPLDKDLKTPVCMARVAPSVVVRAIENHYQDWKENRENHGMVLSG